MLRVAFFYCYAECHYVEYCSFTVLFSVMLNVVLLIVVAPTEISYRHVTGLSLSVLPSLLLKLSTKLLLIKMGCFGKITKHTEKLFDAGKQLRFKDFSHFRVNLQSQVYV